jgi:endonuclease YncB( thermonuclease family)
MYRAGAAVAALSLCALQAFAADFSDVPSVVDGETLEILSSGQHVRIWGIDAPERGQRCRRPEGEFDCGHFSAMILGSLINGRQVDCRERSRDRHKRPVATCTVDGVDLGGTMVSLGWALDFPQFSGGEYQFEESQARGAKRGLWAGEFERPSDYRRRSR